MADYQDLIKNAGMNAYKLPNANVPVNQLVGFQQNPQDQYVDNRTTSAGSEIVDTRTPAQIGYDNTIQNQGLYDMSLDFAIPAGQAIGGVLRGGAGLGLRGLEGMSNLRQGIQAGVGTGILANEGRRQAMKVGAAGLGSAGVTLDPLANLAVKGLGLSDNAIAAKAPVNIANLENRINLMDTAFQRTLQNGTRGKITMPSMLKAEQNYHNAIIKAEPSMGDDIVKMLKTGDDDPGLNFALQNLNIRNKDVANALTKQSDVWRQAKRIQEKSKIKINNARTSKEPVLSPKELTSQILKTKEKQNKVSNKIDKFYKSKYGENHPSMEYNMIQFNKYDDQLKGLENQLVKLNKTGKYGKTKGIKHIDDTLPMPPREVNIFK